MMKKEIRKLKVASVLHKAVSKVLIDSHKNVLISGVELNKDLSKADVYIIISSLSNESCDISSIIHEMNKSAWLIRKSVSGHVQLRFMPNLIFKPDLGFHNFVNINRVLQSQ